jgi:hypothetical protein
MEKVIENEMRGKSRMRDQLCPTTRKVRERYRSRQNGTPLKVDPLQTPRRLAGSTGNLLRGFMGLVWPGGGGKRGWHSWLNFTATVRYDVWQAGQLRGGQAFDEAGRAPISGEFVRSPQSQFPSAIVYDKDDSRGDLKKSTDLKARGARRVILEGERIDPVVTVPRPVCEA